MGGFNMEYVKSVRRIPRLHGTDEFEGTGIGLANGQIITRHGGQTRAEGEVDKVDHLLQPAA